MITLKTSYQLQRMIASVLKQLFRTNFFLVFFGGGEKKDLPYNSKAAFLLFNDVLERLLLSGGQRP